MLEDIKRKTLEPLPATPYEYVDIINACVNIDYHIEYKRNYYSNLRLSR
ncbi:MAG: hypothetical protein ACI9XK_002167 [Granulosicoccus sp.]|jgi:hypothetical protein